MRPGLFVHPFEVSIGREHVQPLWIEPVNLARILAQRGETGGVPGHVEGGADAFIAVQSYLGGSNVGAPVTAPQCTQAAPVAFLVSLGLFERVVWPLFKRQEKLRQRLADGGVDEHHDHGAQENSCYVEQCPETPPARSLRIVENRLCHAPKPTSS